MVEDRELTATAKCPGDLDWLQHNPGQTAELGWGGRRRHDVPSLRLMQYHLQPKGGNEDHTAALVLGRKWLEPDPSERASNLCKAGLD